MASEAVLTSIKEVENYLLVAAFGFARMFGFTMLMPLFSRVPLSGLVRNGVVLALMLPVFPVIMERLAASPISMNFIILYVGKELVVGITVGLVMGIPFWAAEAAGDLLDLQRGSTMGTLIDPMMTHETSATGTLLAIIMITIFLAAGGLEMSLRIFYDSYRVWPVDQLAPIFGKEAVDTLLNLLVRIATMAVTLVFPLILCIFLSDIALAFLARASPHLNVFALSLAVKTLVFSVVFTLYASFLIYYMYRDLGFLNDAAKLIGVLAPGST